MASYQEVALLAAREIEITVRGIKFRVVENLYVDPKAAIATRERIGKLLKDTESAIRKAREMKKGKPEDKEEQELEMVLASAKMQTAVDERETAIEAICSRVRSWDVTDVDQLPFDLDEASLYKSPIATMFFQESLKAMDETPIVPLASG